LFMNSPKISEF